MIRHALDISVPTLSETVEPVFYNGGGHQQWADYFHVVNARLHDDLTLLTTIGDDDPGMITQQPFVMTAEKLALCRPFRQNETQGPFTWAIRKPQSVSGKVITFPVRLTNGTSGNRLDPTWLNLTGMHMVRVSDNKVIQFADDAKGDRGIVAKPWTVTIKSQPTPAISANDEFYFAPDHPVEVGDICWSIKNAGPAFNAFNPSPNATYLPLFKPAGFLMFLYGANMFQHSGTSYDVTRDWTLQAATQTKPTPAEPYALPWSGNKIGSEVYNRTSAFWSAHGFRLIPELAAPVVAPPTLVNTIPGPANMRGGTNFMPNSTRLTMTALVDMGGSAGQPLPAMGPVRGNERLRPSRRRGKSASG